LTTYTIGKLAERTDVSVETIRYYERRGLLERPPRPSSGYRRYTDEAHRRLSFIRKAKALGFTLGEIEELLELNTDSPAACREVEVAATRCVERIDAQVRALLQMKRALEALVARCGADHTEGACPIIEALEEAENETDAD
jgi:MerR family mercuric resistance operon transcriptional regulator